MMQRDALPGSVVFPAFNLRISPVAESERCSKLSMPHCDDVVLPIPYEHFAPPCWNEFGRKRYDRVLREVIKLMTAESKMFAEIET